ncbi:Fur family transcriptional regulator [Pseudorhodoferax sp.]|uniref:Fur family transcriptional regulator n=1 Tax=Pseudorhodoferax sp. TaxID=1993553 RepID=UPI0039E6A27B
MPRKTAPRAPVQTAKRPTPARHRQALAEARARCAARGAQLTEQRALVLELLLARNGAAKAYELLADMREQNPGVAPMTVYRALDFLVEQGLVHKVTATSSFVVCTHGPHPHNDPLFLVCGRCGDTTEWDNPTLGDQIEQALAGLGMHAHGVEISVDCARCRAQQRPSSR